MKLAECMISDERTSDPDFWSFLIFEIICNKSIFGTSKQNVECYNYLQIKQKLKYFEEMTFVPPNLNIIKLVLKFILFALLPDKTENYVLFEVIHL